MTYRYPGGLVRRTAANTAITGASGVWDLGSQAQAVRNNTWPISGLANPVSGSLRFRNSASAYLSRTSVSPTNNKIFTWSGWVKVGMGTNGITGPHNLIDGVVDLDNESVIRLQGPITFAIFTGGSYKVNVDTSSTFRDPSAWYHIVVAVDTTQATSTNGVKIYVNGVQQTLTVSTYIQNSATQINTSSVTQQIGKDTFSGSNRFADYYLTEVNFVDGQQLTPASFGQTSAITGVWEPIKYTGTYGNNGFYFSLSDTSSIGKDFSGNGNNWTPNNISTTSGSTFDLMRDVPTQYTPQGATDVGGTVRGNYCVLNPIFNVNGTNVTYSNGNLTYSHPSNSGNAQLMAVRGTIALPAGKYYWEYIVGATVNDQVGIGNDVALGGSPDGTAGARYINSGAFQSNYTTPSSAASYTTGDIIGMAYDQPNGTLAFYKNNSLQGTITGISTTEVFFPSRSPNSSGSGGAGSFNFGQQSFTYTPPSGFKSLCTTNLPNSNIVKGSDYFNAVLYTGNSSTTQNINTGISPDFVWIKSRTSGTGHHSLIDRVRGDIALNSNQTIVEYGVSDFNMNTDGTIDVPFYANDYSMNTSGNSYVAWNWKAGGTTVTNTNGTRTSTVSVNITAGFSIVTYSGNSTRTITVGHGLGVTPSMIIIKNRSADTNWPVYHSSVGASKYLYLNTTQTETTDTNMWNNTAPSSTVFSLGDTTGGNGNGHNLVAYCFAPIAGFSAFGSYTGNASTDGPFVYTGFRPRFVMIKKTSDTGNWWMIDTARSTYNQMADVLLADSSGAEFASGTGWPGIDYLSNGFKLRGSATGINGSGATYIYMAFAEHPFKNSLAR